MKQQTLVIIGAGPKAMALAAKVCVLRKMGIPTPQLIIIEKNQVGSHWTGKKGFTTGHLPLGTSPDKDVGFPYQTKIFHDSRDFEVNQKMREYSFSEYLIEEGLYSQFIDSGRPAPPHHQWAKYLRFVAEKSQVEIQIDEVVLIQKDRDLFRVSLQSGGEIAANGVVITGPGDDRLPSETFPSHPQLIRSADFGKLQELSDQQIAVLGAGESAASAVSALMGRGNQITVYTPRGTLLTRGENYFENHLYSDVPQVWKDLPIATRREIISRTDRGVFSRAVADQIHYQSGIKVVPEYVTGLSHKEDHLQVNSRMGDRTTQLSYDYVVAAMGFDHLTFVKRLFPELKARDLEAEIESDLSLKDHNIHIPMLAGLSQGPGFSNLSSLGLLSDRILASYIGAAA